MHLGTLFLLGLEGCYGLLQRGYLFLGVALLLALHGDHLFRRILHETLIGELLQDACQETFQVLQLRLQLGNLGIDIDEVAQRYGKLVGTHHEG